MLAAALEIFGRDGFHAASTRAIAETAGVNQALIGYHFGGKEGLYLAVFEAIMDSMQEHMGPLLETMSIEVDRLRGSTPEGRRQCLQALDRIMTGAVTMFSQPDARGWTRLFMREQQDPGEAFDIIHGGLYGEMLEIFTQLVGKLVDRSPADTSTRLLTLTLMGQLMVPMIARGTTTRHLGWDEIGENEIRLLYQQVREGLYARFGEEVPA